MRVRARGCCVDGGRRAEWRTSRPTACVALEQRGLLRSWRVYSEKKPFRGTWRSRCGERSAAGRCGRRWRGGEDEGEESGEDGELASSPSTMLPPTTTGSSRSSTSDDKRHARADDSKLTLASCCLESKAMQVVVRGQAEEHARPSQAAQWPVVVRVRPSCRLLGPASADPLDPPPLTSQRHHPAMPAFFSSYRAPRELHQEASVFPAEIVRHILSFAEPASLAACCTTSYALLEIASADLYDHVEIVGLERLRRLFCERVSEL